MRFILYLEVLHGVVGIALQGNASSKEKKKQRDIDDFFVALHDGDLPTVENVLFNIEFSVFTA